MKTLLPVFALGKNSEEIVSGIAISQQWIGGVDGVANFPVGTPVFASESDYTETQYMGLVTVQDIPNKLLTVQCESKYLLNSSPKIWKPTAYWLPDVEESKDQILTDFAAVSKVTKSGVGYRARSSITKRIKRFSWDKLDSTDFELLETFCETTLQNTLQRFTVAWYCSKKEQVRIATVMINQSNLDFNSVNSGLAEPVTIDIYLITENLYT